jgi:hypothetical protein
MVLGSLLAEKALHILKGKLHMKCASLREGDASLLQLKLHCRTGMRYYLKLMLYIMGKSPLKGTLFPIIYSMSLR